MLKVVNLHKSGFVALSGAVKILDDKLRPFYYFDFSGKSNKSFNLPEGVFYVMEGEIKRLEKPLTYKIKKLPIHSYLGRKSPKNFKLIVAPNPNKASIDFAKGVITIDPVYKYKPRLILDYILAHEFGHRFYSEQHYADHYAKYLMLKEGYNPSQIAFAIHFGISNRSNYRKDYLLKQKVKIKTDGKSK